MIVAVNFAETSLCVPTRASFDYMYVAACTTRDTIICSVCGARATLYSTHSVTASINCEQIRLIVLLLSHDLTVQST